MAEVNIGQHCSVSTCNQLDFLPFVCSGCSGVYCLDHKSQDAHNCSKCNPSRDDKAEYISPVSYDCTLSGCKRAELVPVTCEHCHKNFCLSHRHQADHQCEMLSKEEEPPPMAKTTQLIQQITASKKSDETKVKTKGRGVKSAKMAAKVALMKMKMHALGDQSIPQKERVFFHVHLPKSCTDRHKPMFFSSMWSVGKAVDRTAALLSLKNENNIASAKKLRMFHPESGDVLAMDAKLESLLAAESDLPLYSGGGIILEYVDNHCIRLANVTEYQS
ncbi:AN1-type zinc finger protein 1-like [Diadema setosum]|uniref:AN1-type zinc finger protein 1-like n=1 Tax=Diadema setosum TaxID=31175 RepID=UPI003B3A6659